METDHKQLFLVLKKEAVSRVSQLQNKLLNVSSGEEIRLVPIFKHINTKAWLALLTDILDIFSNLYISMKRNNSIIFPKGS